MLFYFIFAIIFIAILLTISSRIRKAARAAFEREMIETEDFRLVKPEGFLSPVNNLSEYAFEAYTREFGKDKAGNFREAWANLKVYSNSSFRTVCDNARKSADKILSKDFAEENGRKMYLLQSERTENEVEIQGFRHIIENRKKNKIFDLQLSVLKENADDYAERIKEMLGSFQIK